jgi:putative pyruvate formate lyase activating enzyme
VPSSDLSAIAETSPRAWIDRAALDRAIAWAAEAYRACDVCAERCGVDRMQGPAGLCGLPAGGRIYKEYLHFGEERRLVPSHTVFLSGCNFRCAFCSDWDAVVDPLAHGAEVDPRAVAHRIVQRRAEGARNVNFVGGLPDVNVRYLLRVLAHVPADTRVVWNTNLWTTETAIDHLLDVVATWLVDLKFGNALCARKLSRAHDYWDIITRLFLHLVPAVRARERSIIVRHLLMPGHLACCTEPVLRWLADNAREVPVNLMTGYLPYRISGNASAPMGGRLARAEVDAALTLFSSLGFMDPMVDGVEECH